MASVPVAVACAVLSYINIVILMAPLALPVAPLALAVRRATAFFIMNLLVSAQCCPGPDGTLKALSLEGHGAARAVTLM